MAADGLPIEVACECSMCQCRATTAGSTGHCRRTPDRAPGIGPLLWVCWLVFVSALVSVLDGGEPSKTAVWPPGVVFIPPILDQYAGLGERSELGDVQQFVPDSAVERLNHGFCHGDPGSM